VQVAAWWWQWCTWDVDMDVDVDVDVEWMLDGWWAWSWSLVFGSSAAHCSACLTRQRQVQPVNALRKIPNQTGIIFHFKQKIL